MNRAEDKKRRFWKPMIAHINKIWKSAAKQNCNYPFTGKDFADLRYHANNFGEWGIMAMWDLYVSGADIYVKKRNYDIFTFTRSFPRLLEHPLFKGRREHYERELCPPLPPVVDSAVSQIADAMDAKRPPKHDKQAEKVGKWNKARKLREALEGPSLFEGLR